MTEKPKTTCATCLHCSQDGPFPLCLESVVPPEYDGVWGSNMNPRFWDCHWARPERGECGLWKPIPTPANWRERLLRAIGCHPWLWGRR